MAWRDYIVRDLGWKLFSLLLAILIWGIFRHPHDEEGVPVRPSLTNPLQAATASSLATSEPITRPVVVLRPPADTYRYRITPPLVDVVVQGDDAVLNALNEEEIVAFVDTSELERNTNATAPGVACAIQVHAPRGIQFVKSTPTAVQVERLPAPPSSDIPTPTAP